MADCVDVSLFLDSHHDDVLMGLCPPERPLVDLVLLQDGVLGLEEYVSPLVRVHPLVPTFSQPHVLINLSSFLVCFTLQNVYNVIVMGILHGLHGQPFN